ncbi:hypothetical protein L1987_33094 [Smallanthus sonchifolius]|uniref:Uncharacterized protein n=1 Tax=Smallanthus sonchifolius TaxID=185202 RepID=A0ACB9HRE5_9ASTR|nr:hypothetical protein L1987_33094 [Smallanthus sonchifolius]
MAGDKKAKERIGEMEEDTIDWSSKGMVPLVEVETQVMVVGLGRQVESGTTPDIGSAPNPNHEFKMHGESQTSCMGTGENNIKDLPSNGIKDKMFFFEVEKSNDDPFQIDDIINGSGKVEKEITKQAIPDLNSSMGAPPGENMEIQTENGGNKTHGGNNDNKESEEEIQATIEIGQMMGVDIRNNDELVRTVIQGKENRKRFP